MCILFVSYLYHICRWTVSKHTWSSGKLQRSWRRGCQTWYWLLVLLWHDNMVLIWMDIIHAGESTGSNICVTTTNNQKPILIKPMTNNQEPTNDNKQSTAINQQPITYIWRNRDILSGQSTGSNICGTTISLEMNKKFSQCYQWRCNHNFLILVKVQ